MADQTKRVETSPAGGTAADKAEQGDELARLRAENETLRQRLASVPGTTAGLSRGGGKRPFLTEGERLDLEQNGVTNSPFNGERLTAEGEGVETKAKADVTVPRSRSGDRSAIEGFDYVYPSVAPGVLDPKLTGEK